MLSGSRVRDQSPVVLTTVGRQVGWVCAVIAHVAQLYSAGGEAGPRRLVAGSLIPVIRLRFNMFIVFYVIYTKIHIQGLVNDAAPPW
jgi:hypothetical protein